MAKRTQNRYKKLITTPGLALGLAVGTTFPGLVTAQQDAPALDPVTSSAVPALVVRSSVHDAALVNDCQVDLRRADNSAGYKLLVHVPDTVNEIDIVPATAEGAERRFRIRVDEVDLLALQRPVSQIPALNVGHEMETETGLPKAQPPRFKANPFFDQSVAATAERPGLEDNSSPAQPLVYRLNDYYQPAQPASKVSPASMTAEVVRYPSPEVTATEPIAPSLADEIIEQLATVDANQAPAELDLMGPDTPPQEPEQDTRTKALPATHSILELTPAKAPAAVTVSEVTPEDRQTASQNEQAGVQLDLADLSETVDDSTGEIASTQAMEPERDPLSVTFSDYQDSIEPQPLKLLTEGPTTMPLNETADFAVILKNSGTAAESDLNIRLTLPEGLKVTVLDREADYDAQQHSITWQIPQSNPGESVVIRYRVKSIGTGRMTQRLQLGQDGVYGPATTVSTHAVSAAR